MKNLKLCMTMALIVISPANQTFTAATSNETATLAAPVDQVLVPSTPEVAPVAATPAQASPAVQVTAPLVEVVVPAITQPATSSVDQTVVAPVAPCTPCSETQASWWNSVQSKTKAAMAAVYTYTVQGLVEIKSMIW